MAVVARQWSSAKPENLTTEERGLRWGSLRPDADRVIVRAEQSGCITALNFGKGAGEGRAGAGNWTIAWPAPSWSRRRPTRSWSSEIRPTVLSNCNRRIYPGAGA